MGSIPVAVTWTSDSAPVVNMELFDFQETTECRFNLKHVCDMIRTHNQKILGYFIEADV